tara:strand:+ start:6170 stop:7261 length:1092 start_codon:yes stop_codon:yes gene_type:complete
MNIPIYQPYLEGNANKYVNECLESGWISSKGKFVKKFEEAFSTFLGGGFSTSVSNGTCALHLALLALGIKEGDEVLVPALTYIASVNCIKYIGAKPVLVEVDKDTWNIDTSKIEAKITKNTKAILAVHLYGALCNTDNLKEISNLHNLYLIEDAAEAFGSKYKSQYAGTFSDIATFSFFGNKTITTGEGGMVYSQNKNLIDKAAYLKNQAVSPSIEYWHEMIGYNYRMTNIQAAIGLSQLELAEIILNKKRKIYQSYKNNLTGLPISFQLESEETSHSFWMVVIIMNNENIKDKMKDYLSNEGIETRRIFHPINSLPPYKDNEIYDISNAISQRGLCLPSHPNLTNNEVEYISSKIRKFFAYH